MKVIQELEIPNYWLAKRKIEVLVEKYGRENVLITNNDEVYNIKVIQKEQDYER